MSNQPTFLYVEDDETSRDVMEMTLLYRMGYENLVIFDDSTDFISRVEALPHPPDVIFLDIHMEPHSGFEMLKMLREHPTYGSLKVVALTASVMNEEVEALEAAGFDSTIAKPIDPDLFPNLVERILEGKRVWYVA